MPWTEPDRVEHNRGALRYPSDLTDREWALIEPLPPAAKPGGRPRKTDLRAVVDAIGFIGSSGAQWRMLPKDFPPASMVRGYFYAWRDRRLRQSVNHLLVMAARELEGREASPTAGVIDSQSVKTTKSGGFRAMASHGAAIGPRPMANGKKIKGRMRVRRLSRTGGVRRLTVTDTLGLMLFALIHSASVQDRDGAPGPA